MHLEMLKILPFEDLPLENIINLFEKVEEKVRPTLNISEKYRK
jgi:hypothetical protein